MRHIKLEVTSLSGSPNRNSLSKRPGRRSAGSMESSRFVAPITTTSPRLSNPSIRARSVDTMELQDGGNEAKRTKLNYSTVFIWVSAFVILFGSKSCRTSDSPSLPKADHEERGRANKSISACRRAYLLQFCFLCWVSLFWPVYLVLSAGSDRSQTVDLVKEDDGGTHLIRLRMTRTAAL